MKKIIQYIKTHKLYTLLCILTIIKIIYITDLPVIGRSNRIYDESLMTDLATSLKDEDYLGNYSNKTLVKGYGYPFLMACFSLLHIPYLLGLSTLYALACFLFTHSLKKYIEKPGYLALIYLVLLMNPASFAKDTYLVLYRNSLGIIYSLLFISSLIKLYQHRNDKKLYLYAFCIGLLLFMIDFIRGDIGWTIPAIVILLLCIIKKKQQLLSIPLIVIPSLIGILTISVLNLYYYHIFTDNEIKHSNYTKAFGNLLKIELQGTQYDRVSITHDTIKKAISVSPTLQSIEPHIEHLYELGQWASKMEDGTMEIENAYTVWALRDALNNSGGYQNAETADTFWKKVANELDQAFANGTLKKRTTLPWILANIPSLEKTPLFLKNTLTTIQFSTSFDKLYVTIASTYKDKQKVEALTHQKVIDNDQIGYQKEYPYKNKIKILSSIKNIYHVLGFPCFLTAMIIYLIHLGNTFIRRKKDDLLLINTLILISYLSLIASISYTQTFSFDTISAFYLNPVYSLQLAFFLLELVYLIDHICKKLKLDRTIF